MSNEVMIPVSFWSFISNNKIEIPIIQRDYVQGKKGKEGLRNDFLRDIKKSLDNPAEILKLDFIYGLDNEEQYVPLDGQQRLTTLWLLHWYLALKSDNFENDVRVIMEKFSYKTRVSSRDFIKCLVTKNISADGDLEKEIYNKTWFQSCWKQDPTIQSIIGMLDSRVDNKYEFDSIVKVFKGCTLEDYKRYWNILISKNCPIVFYSLQLSQIIQSDDLYIKMNARGKALTDFENLKTDLIKLWQRVFDSSDKKDCKTFEYKLDNDWLDIFWKYRSPAFEVDDIYLNFIKRYFVTAIIVGKKDNSYLYSVDEIEDNRLFKLLMSKDERISLEDILNEDQIFNKDLLNSLKNSLDNFSNKINTENYTNLVDDINAEFSPKWRKCTSLFIPEYVVNKKKKSIDEPEFVAESITIEQRVVFFAICRYFEKNHFNSEAFKNWIRVIWNIVENSNKDYIPLVRLVDLLSKGSNDILNYLGSLAIDHTMYAKDQLKEEIEKAKKIINNEEWKKKIEAAENYSFFKGAIRFLYTNEEGKSDWDICFDKKWANVQKYISEDNKCFFPQYYSQFVTGFIKAIKDWRNLYDKQLFNNNTATWKYILLNDQYIEQVHLCLMADDVNNIEMQLFDESFLCENNIKKELVSSGIIDILIADYPNYRIKWNGQIALYEPYGRNAIVLDWIANGEDWEKRRNSVLRELVLLQNNDIEIKNTIITKSDIMFFNGWEVDFVCSGVNLRWNSDNFIYLMNTNWNYQKDNNGDIRLDASMLTIVNVKNELASFINSKLSLQNIVYK